jgi:hypothetical protein
MIGGLDYKRVHTRTLYHSFIRSNLDDATNLRATQTSDVNIAYAGVAYYQRFGLIDLDVLEV